jgi:hypothetical protein
MDATALTSEDGAVDAASMDSPAGDVLPVDAAGPIPDRPAGPDVISTEAIGYASLVAYWPLDEGMGDYVYDITSNGNDGRFILAPTWSAGGAPAIAARSKWKLQVDGEYAFVEVVPRTLPAFDKPKSITFWTRYDYEVDPIRLQTLVAFINREAGAGVRIEFRKGRLAVTGLQLQRDRQSSTTEAGWHHIAYTFDGNVHTCILNGGANITSGGWRCRASPPRWCRRR